MARILPFRSIETESGPLPAARLQQPRLGEVLVASGALKADDLARALAEQRDQEAPLGRILVAAHAISPDALVAALADQSGYGLIDLRRMPVDAGLMAGLDPYRCLELEAVPWRQVGGTRIVALSSPERSEAAAAALGGDAERVAVGLARPEDIRRSIVAEFGERLRDDAKRRCPEPFSCRGIGTPRVRRRALGGAGALIAAALAAPIVALQLVMAWILIANLLTMGLRLVAIFAHFQARRAPERPDAPHLADYKRLPTVSVLVPLKGEAAVAGALIRALGSIDYPQALLDIKLVLEENDLPTRLAVDQAELPPCVEILTVPRDTLETKPKAMNFALPFCRGSIVGVYDAEDRPDPGQIRAVVRKLQQAPPEVACVQGYLDFYNVTDNWLSRCFTIEYAIWFRVLLHGVQRLGIPIPLGGTSVFFRRGVLERIGAWDAHNVTEDADLGMRLARFGYRCEMIASTTLEEANCAPRRWIRQRSRWLKGYAITWATHMRRPAALWRDLGWRGFLGFQVILLGAITSYLSIPLFWMISGATLGLGLSFWHTMPHELMWSFFLSMIVGQAVMLTVAVIALWDSGRSRMIPWILTLPFYWPLGAVAAYRAVGEIFTNPFHWHKTEHGFARTSDAPDPA